MELVLRDVDVKSVLTKSDLPVADYSVDPYTGCAHACRYCYASFMKRFSNHAEPWGGFVDVKHWPEIKDPKRYAGKELFIGSVTDPYDMVYFLIFLSSVSRQLGSFYFCVMSRSFIVVSPGKAMVV